jgi:hypothetical protein
MSSPRMHHSLPHNHHSFMLPVLRRQSRASIMMMHEQFTASAMGVVPEGMRVAHSALNGETDDATATPNDKASKRSASSNKQAKVRRVRVDRIKVKDSSTDIQRHESSVKLLPPLAKYWPKKVTQFRA